VSAPAGTAVWYLMRGSGIVALLLFTAVVALGVATSTRTRVGPLPRFATVALHRSIALLSVAFLALHVGTALLDPYAHVRALDAVLPFAAHTHAFAVGLGTLSLDILAALVVTSLLRRRIGQRAWRAIHWLAYVSWPVAVAHALGIGSDTRTLWLRTLALGAILVVAASVAWRIARRGDRGVLRAPAAVAAARSGR
jgi:sulfoxide reductase heme-binding subunit YedZ